MKIPKKIKLIGRTIKIKFLDNLTQDRDLYGEAQFGVNKILLQKRVKGNKLDDSQIGTTFLHELLHWVFYVMGESELRQNEKLIDAMSEILYQVFAKNNIDFREGKFNEK